MVGSDERMRVSSPMTPSLIGTLKSTRTKTRLPLRSRSVMETFAMKFEDLRNWGCEDLRDLRTRALATDSQIPKSSNPHIHSPFFTKRRSRSTQRFEYPHSL